MRVLIDTNIVIYREDAQIISESIQKLTRLLNHLKITILVHPLSLQELERNPNRIQKNVMVSKILSYPPIESILDPSNDEFFLKTIQSSSRRNDLTDNAILYTVYRNAVNFLITEDLGIHRKASRLQIEDKVLTIDEAIDFFKRDLQDHDVISPPALVSEYVYKLDVKDPFFDSLKPQYPGFEGIWFPKICSEPRRCFVNFQGNRIGALLIYNIEENDGIKDSNPPLPNNRRLKLCTFKVSNNGQKIGELLIKLSIQIAIKNKISEIYLTHFIEENDSLVNLLLNFGFYYFGKKPNGEAIYLKNILGTQKDATLLTPNEFNKKFYPSYYDGEKVKKFIIPIKPVFLERLFTDLPDRQSSIFEHHGDFYSEGNAINKIYISRTKSKKLKQNDVILFYRSHHNQAITSLGVVDGFYPDLSDNDSIMEKVFRRTVYSRKEIEEMPKPVSVISFKYHFHFPRHIPYSELIKMNLIKTAPLSVNELNEESYRKIKELGGLDERFAFN